MNPTFNKYVLKHVYDVVIENVPIQYCEAFCIFVTNNQTGKYENIKFAICCIVP